MLDQLFEEIQKDSQRKIVTSVISITEVTHVSEERLLKRVDDKVRETLDNFWADSTLLEFVDFNELIARQARDLIRRVIPLGYVLKSHDAIHLATAKYVDAKECFTYDDKLHKYNSYVGLNILSPYVSSPKLPLFSSDDPDE